MGNEVKANRISLIELSADQNIPLELLADTFNAEFLNSLEFNWNLVESQVEGHSYVPSNSFWCFKYGTSSFIKKAEYNENDDLVFKKIPELPTPKSINFKPKNLEQSILMHQIYDENIPWVTVFGGAGTGKTYVALACALDLLEKKKYDKIILVKSRAQAFTGSSGRIGDIPGDLIQKLLPVLNSYLRAMAKIWGKSYMATFESYLNTGKIEVATLEYMRGEDYSNAIIICDEAQNVEEHQFGTLLTRIGNKSKLIMMADTDQIDEKENRKMLRAPLIRAVETTEYVSSSLTSFVELIEQERSPLVSLSIAIMKKLRA